jgi:hypothetical protein
MVTPPPIVASTMRCSQCGYDLTGAIVGGVCPECGMSVAESIGRMTQGVKSCGAATACMVLGICSIAVCMLCGPVAIFLYYKAVKQINTGGYSDSSRTMAKAGLIMGIIGTCIVGVYALLFGLGALM